MLARLLDKCTCLYHLKQIHALLASSGLANHPPFACKILSFAASSHIRYAHRFLLHLPNPTIFHYNAVIRGFSYSSTPHQSILVYLHSFLNGLEPDHLTYPFLVKASARLSDPKLGGCIHGQVVGFGFVSDLYICNSLIHMYGSCGEIGNAEKLFDEMPQKNLVSWNSILDAFAKCGNVVSMWKVFDAMPERNVVSWSSLIDGCVKHGSHWEALSIFAQMRAAGPSANEVTMVGVLCACSHLGALEQGKAIHQYIVENKLCMTLILKTALVDMYAKCGAIVEAWLVFRDVCVGNTDVLIWNAMIGGLATHGYTAVALSLHEEMQKMGIKSDEITYLCLLNACAHGGLVKEAWEFFSAIAKCGMTAKIEHYACMVDVLARAGCLVEAQQLVLGMPVEPTASMLGSLLNGCLNHRKLNLAEVVGKRLVELEPDHDGRYVGLSNVYAASKCWDEARSARESMEIRRVKKLPGCSFVEVLGGLHRFIAHDKGHCKSAEIYQILHVIVEQMKLGADLEKEETACSLSL